MFPYVILSFHIQRKTHSQKEKFLSQIHHFSSPSKGRGPTLSAIFSFRLRYVIMKFLDYVINYLVCSHWASLVAQMIKNLPVMWETWVQSLGGEDLLEEGMATHSSIFAWRIPMDRGAWWATVHGVAKSWLLPSD